MYSVCALMCSNSKNVTHRARLSFRWLSVIQLGVGAGITWGAHLHRPYWTPMIECMPNKLEWEFKWGSDCLWGKLKQTPGQLAEKSLWLMVSVWDRSTAVGGCFGLLRRTDFVCLSIAYSVTVWFWKCLLCFHRLHSVTPRPIKTMLLFYLFSWDVNA